MRQNGCDGRDGGFGCFLAFGGCAYAASRVRREPAIWKGLFSCLHSLPNSTDGVLFRMHAITYQQFTLAATNIHHSTSIFLHFIDIGLPHIHMPPALDEWLLSRCIGYNNLTWRSISRLSFVHQFS